MATLNIKTNNICQQYGGPYWLFVQPRLWFCFRAHSKAPREGQVFPNATCNNHSLVVLFVDWSIMKLCYSLEKFNCRGWCRPLGRSSPNRASGRISPMLPYVFRSVKWWQNYFDVITISSNLMQDYRKVKEEWKETIALEVVTMARITKLKRMIRNMYTRREHDTGHVFCFVCRLLLCW